MLGETVGGSATAPVKPSTKTKVAPISAIRIVVLLKHQYLSLDSQ
jgi:hypothetical protein